MSFTGLKTLFDFNRFLHQLQIVVPFWSTFIYAQCGIISIPVQIIMATTADHFRDGLWSLIITQQLILKGSVILGHASTIAICILSHIMFLRKKKMKKKTLCF